MGAMARSVVMSSVYGPRNSEATNSTRSAKRTNPFKKRFQNGTNDAHYWFTSEAARLTVMVRLAALSLVLYTVLPRNLARFAFLVPDNTETNTVARGPLVRVSPIS